MMPTDNGSPQWQGKEWSEITEVVSEKESQQAEVITRGYSLAKIKWL